MAPHVLRRASLLAPLALAMLAGCHDNTATAPIKRPTLNLTQGVGGVWTVNTLGDPGDGACDDAECTLREAIAAAASGDRIAFASGLTGDVKLAGQRLVITRSLTIDGAGRIAVDAQRGSSVILVTTLDAANPGPVVTLTRLTLKNGFRDGSSGGGLHVAAGEATLDSVTIANNEATFTGGGIEIGTGGTSRSGTAPSPATRRGRAAEAFTSSRARSR